jgi:hypothetical protein
MVNGQQYTAYGAAPQFIDEEGEIIEPHVKPPWLGRMRLRMNLMAVFVSLFFPWLLFNGLFANLSLRFHYKYPEECWAIVGLAALVVFGIGGLAAMNVKQMLARSMRYQPMWYIFLFLTSLVALVLGPFFGNKNFWNWMQPYYILQGLNDYSGVDPSRMRGQQMMDAGRMQFASNATLDLRRAYAFQNLDTYCVAPISMHSEAMGSPLPLNSYDFWAVGINCCAGNATHAVDFKCGTITSEYSRLHEGLRIVDDERRPFYRLAVQQAEAAFALKAIHPLFFHWTDDAVGGIEHYKQMAYKNFAIAMVVSFIIQVSLVMAATYGLAKTGHHNL